MPPPPTLTSPPAPYKLFLWEANSATSFTPCTNGVVCGVRGDFTSTFGDSAAGLLGTMGFTDRRGSLFVAESLAGASLERGGGGAGGAEFGFREADFFRICCMWLVGVAGCILCCCGPLLMLLSAFTSHLLFSSDAELFSTVLELPPFPVASLICTPAADDDTTLGFTKYADVTVGFLDGGGGGGRVGRAWWSDPRELALL